MLELVTGGSGSGKSAFAEDWILSGGEGKRIYIATMEPFGTEGARRIARHRKMREGKGFETVERYTDLNGLRIPENSHVLLECMSNLVANEIFREDGAGDRVLEAVVSGVRHLQAAAGRFCIVTNDILSDGVCYEQETVQYQKYLSQVNQELARMANEVIEVVYGVPVYQKGNALQSLKSGPELAADPERKGGER